MEYPYKIVACGGTFDRLHRGHKAFLEFAFSKGQTVLIGLTSDKFVARNKKKKNILPYIKRQKYLKEFLQNKGFLKRAKIIPIDDPFGPAIRDESINALIVTEDTLSGAEEINRIRSKSGLFPVHVISIPVIKIADVKISSSFIRNKIMNIHGDLILPDFLRDSLKKPFGLIITDAMSISKLDPQKVVAIGDVTTKICNDLNINQKFSVIDFFVKREKTYDSLQELGFKGTESVIYAKNPPGHITGSLWNAVSIILRSTINSRSIIVVDGEEDLAVVPFVLLLPVGWHILYGQPDQGMVHIQVNGKIKKEFVRLITLFKRTTRGH